MGYFQKDNNGLDSNRFQTSLGRFCLSSIHCILHMLLLLHQRPCFFLSLIVLTTFVWIQVHIHEMVSESHKKRSIGSSSDPLIVKPMRSLAPLTRTPFRPALPTKPLEMMSGSLASKITAPSQPSIRSPDLVPGTPAASVTPSPSSSPPQMTKDIRPTAFATIVSNEEYIDGALVLGHSLRKHSKLLKQNGSVLVVVTTSRVSGMSVARLVDAGWVVTVVQDLTEKCSGSHWKETFNKLYLFGGSFLRYRMVAFLDADMLILSDPDSIFDTKLPGSDWVGAIGDNPNGKGKPYFQTGMMVFIPNEATYDKLMSRVTNEECRELNARDGSFLREYYRKQYVPIDDAFSMHLKPEEGLAGVIGFHFRGTWKPWMDYAKKPPSADPRRETKLEIGPAYDLWWDTMEDFASTRELHGGISQFPLAARVIQNWENTNNTEPATAATHLWLMRGTESSWTVRRIDFDRAQRDAKQVLPLLQVIPASQLKLPRENCIATCHREQLWCSEEGLLTIQVNSCEALKKAFGCQRCENWRPGKDQPSYDVGKKVCVVNSLRVLSLLPRCEARHMKTQRLCACVPLIDSVGSPRNSSVLDLPNPCDMASLDVAACLKMLSSANTTQANFLPLPSHTDLGRTTKLRVTFPGTSLVAIAKFPQVRSPMEPYAEIAAYELARLLGIDSVPPTTYVTLSLREVMKILKLPGSQRSYEELEGEVQDYNEQQGADPVVLSVQAWQSHIKIFSFSMMSSKDVDPSLELQLSTQIVFDFLIGNEERDHTFQRSYVNGSLVFIDQGRGFHFLRTPKGNPLSMKNATTHCTFEKRLVDRLRQLNQTLGEELWQKLPGGIRNVLSKEIVMAVQTRWEELERYIQRCAALGNETLLVLR